LPDFGLRGGMTFDEDDKDESKAQGGMLMSKSDNEDCLAALDMFIADEKTLAASKLHQALMDKIKEVKLLSPGKEISSTPS
jgi:hypothetical protein